MDNLGYYITAILACIAAKLLLIIYERWKLYNYLFKSSNIPYIPAHSYIMGNHVWFGSKNVMHDTHHYLEEYNADLLGLFIGPEAIVLCRDVDLLYKVFLKDGRKHVNRLRMHIPLKELELSLLQSRDDLWKRSRRAIASALTPAKLKTYNVMKGVDTIVKEFLEALQVVDDQQNEAKTMKDGHSSFEINVHRIFSQFTMETILRLAFDHPSAMHFAQVNQASRSVKRVAAVINATYSSTNKYCQYFPKLVPLFKLLDTTFFNFGAICAKMCKNIDKIIDENAALRNQQMGLQNDTQPSGGAANSGGNQKRDQEPASEKRNENTLNLVHSLVELYEMKQLSRDELRANAFFLLVSGWETTSDVLTCLAWCLAKHKHVQDRLRQELIRYGSETEYLEWVIKETIRLYPPALTARELGEDIEWKDGQILRKGMNLIPSMYSIHRDTRYWGDDCDQFKPERFADTSLHHPAQFFGFGLGPRNCIGGNLAMIEMKFVLTSLLLKYELVCNETTPQKLLVHTPVPWAASIQRNVNLTMVKLAS